MGLIDKFKNLFTEEVEVEVDEKKEGVQKEVIQVEIPSPKKSRSEIYDKEDSKIETTKDDVPEKEEIKQTQKNEYKFPFFDDNDFDSIDVKPEHKEERKKTSFRKDVYNPPKEEKRVFRPSPIISPVYGILDKGYQKDEYSSKTDGRSSYYSSKEANVDAIRNKAYGGLEADIETTLFGGNRVLFNEKEEKKDDILEKIEDVKENKIKEDNFEFGANTIEEKPRHGALEEEDLTDLLEEEMEKTSSQIKQNPKKEPRKISDKELFSLIDSMYEKGNK